MIRSIIVALALLASGCATVGKDIDMSAVDQLKPGVATVADAVALLGPYTSQAANSAGVTVYGWSYARTNGITGKMESKAVMLAFGPDGKLVQKSSSNMPGKMQ
jgi:hypothetical protein